MQPYRGAPSSPKFCLWTLHLAHLLLPMCLRGEGVGSAWWGGLAGHVGMPPPKITELGEEGVLVTLGPTAAVNHSSCRVGKEAGGAGVRRGAWAGRSRTWAGQVAGVLTSHPTHARALSSRTSCPVGTMPGIPHSPPTPCLRKTWVSLGEAASFGVKEALEQEAK